MARAKPRRRAGKTETFSVSVDAQTKGRLKAAAERWHDGNMSRLFTAVARRLTEDAAFERAWAWYEGPEPTPDATADIDAWIDRLAERTAKRKSPAA